MATAVRPEGAVQKREGLLQKLLGRRGNETSASLALVKDEKAILQEEAREKLVLSFAEGADRQLTELIRYVEQLEPTTENIPISENRVFNIIKVINNKLLAAERTQVPDINFIFPDDMQGKSQSYGVAIGQRYVRLREPTARQKLAIARAREILNQLLPHHLRKIVLEDLRRAKAQVDDAYKAESEIRDILQEMEEITKRYRQIALTQ